MSVTLAVRTLSPHPRQAELFHPLEGAAWQDFITDINGRGMMQPVVVSERTGSPVVVDGHQRLRAAVELGHATIEAVVVPFDSEPDEVRALVLNNVRRRQMSRAEVDAVLSYYLRTFTRHANKRIAREVGVSTTRVQRARAKAEGQGFIETLDELETSDGRVVPSKQPRVRQANPQPTEPPAPAAAAPTDPVDASYAATEAEQERYEREVVRPAQEAARQAAAAPPGFRPTAARKQLERLHRDALALYVEDVQQLLASEPPSPVSCRMIVENIMQHFEEMLTPLPGRDEPARQPGKVTN